LGLKLSMVLAVIILGFFPNFSLYVWATGARWLVPKF
jgi:hypothetical protein